jgi:hypothetical protein
MARAMGKVGDLVVKMRKKKFLFSSRSLQILGNETEYDGSKLSSIGYQPKYTLSKGIKNVLSLNKK